MPMASNRKDNFKELVLRLKFVIVSPREGALKRLGNVGLLMALMIWGVAKMPKGNKWKCRRRRSHALLRLVWEQLEKLRFNSSTSIETTIITEDAIVETKCLIIERCKNNLAINKDMKDKKVKNLSFNDRKIAKDNNFPNSLLQLIFQDQTILLIL